MYNKKQSWIKCKETGITKCSQSRWKSITTKLQAPHPTWFCKIFHLFTAKEEQTIFLGQNGIRALASIADDILI
jgi:hypothetical protein